jgi:hypothetical protein
LPTDPDKVFIAVADIQNHDLTHPMRDRNGDGAIDHGRELSGATTGDGFAELAAYDEDGNGWIDENDSIYQHLRIWSKDAQG